MLSISFDAQAHRMFGSKNHKHTTEILNDTGKGIAYVGENMFDAGTQSTTSCASRSSLGVFTPAGPFIAWVACDSDGDKWLGNDTSGQSIWIKNKRSKDKGDQ